MNATPIGWRVQIGTGIALAGMAVAACTVDVLNNRDYGLSFSEEAATVLMIAAIGVVAIPAAAGVMGWTKLKRAATAMCLIATVVSAQDAYSTKQSKVANAARTASDNYEAAQADQKLARDTLNRIKETGDAGELGSMAEKADAKVASDCRRKRSDACKLAEAEAKQAHASLSDAKSRDKAQAILAKAKLEAQAGPGEKREVSQWLTWLLIAVTQLIALLGEYAVSLIAGGWAGRPKRETKAKSARKAKPQGEPDGGSRLPVPSNVVSINAAKNSVKGWLNANTVAGGELRGGEALKAYKRYAGGMGQGMKPGDLRQILAEILGAGAIEARTSGYVVRGVQLRIAAAEGQKAAATC